jgi:hypothetical protein
MLPLRCSAGTKGTIVQRRSVLSLIQLDKGDRMRQSWMKYLLGFFLAAFLSAPAWAANPAQPGTVNYVEGKVFLGSKTIGPNAVGSADVLAGQTISTREGRVEVLLTPGVFLRLDDHSSATMVSPDLTNTVVRLNKGSATVEVDEIHKENHLRVEEGTATTLLKKKGLYAFNADQGTARVLKGEARVTEGDRNLKLKGDHVLALNNNRAKPRKMDKKLYTESSFYQWSNLRSKYLAEANANAAEAYAGGYWPGTGWYWDPWFDSYTFIPGNGILYSPFGWGFYSPLLCYESPFFGYGPYFADYPYLGYGGYPYLGYAREPGEFRHGHFGPTYAGRPPVLRNPGVLVHGGFPRTGNPGTAFHGNPGFHGGPAMRMDDGGAFHGGGGFHAGGSVGGFHGAVGGFHH